MQAPGRDFDASGRVDAILECFRPLLCRWFGKQFDSRRRAQGIRAVGRARQIVAVYSVILCTKDLLKTRRMHPPPIDARKNCPPPHIQRIRSLGMHSREIEVLPHELQLSGGQTAAAESTKACAGSGRHWPRIEKTQGCNEAAAACTAAARIGWRRAHDAAHSAENRCGYIDSGRSLRKKIWRMTCGISAGRCLQMTATNNGRNMRCGGKRCGGAREVYEVCMGVGRAWQSCTVHRSKSNKPEAAKCLVRRPVLELEQGTLTVSTMFNAEFGTVGRCIYALGEPGSIWQHGEKQKSIAST
ncbi:hypothetical protein DFH06DRAFT_1300347 [Mycena polygramma]|nr:hypothetical protein DFH06DRAFT_1300347 [Mycena polygramma]